MPNGTSMALGVGETPVYSLKEEQQVLLVNSRLVDCQVAIETKERDQAKPVIHKQGLFVRVSQSDVINVADSNLAPVTENSREIGEPPLETMRYCGENQIPFKVGEEKQKILKELTTPSPNIVDEMQRVFSFSNETDKGNFEVALESGSIPQEYMKPFLLLLSKVRGPNHKIVLYTESPSIPLQIYCNGICSLEVKDPKDILPGENRTVLAYSSANKSFYTAPPTLLESPEFATKKEAINREWDQKKGVLSAALKTLAEQAKTCSDSKSLQNSLTNLTNELESLNSWLYSAETIPEAYWKRAKREELIQIETSIKNIKEFCETILKLPEVEDDKKFMHILTEMVDAHVVLQDSLLKILPKDEVENITKQITTIPRSWDTLHTLLRLGNNPRDAHYLKAQAGRLLIDTSKQTTDAQDIKKTLEELQPSLLELTKKIDDETELPALKRGLQLLMQPTHPDNERSFIERLTSYPPSWSNSKPEDKAALINIADTLNKALEK